MSYILFLNENNICNNFLLEDEDVESRDAILQMDVMNPMNRKHEQQGNSKNWY